MTNLNDRELYDAYKKIEEAEMQGASKNGGKTKGYDDGASVPVGGGGTVKNDRDQGANDAPKEFDGKGSKIDTAADNKRDAGADNAQSEFEGTKSSANNASTEKRDAGAKNAPDKYETVDAFRNRIRRQIGLPLDAKINKGNSGIQK